MAKKSKQVQEATAANRVASAEAAATGPVRRGARRPDAVRLRKDQRKQQFDKQQKQWFYTKIAIGAVAAIVVGALLWGVWGQFQQWQVSRDVETYFGAEDFVGQHADAPVLYEQVPPTGGVHKGLWQNCGFYDAPIENERGVHSLEHGAVWITFDPDLPQDQIDSLESRAESSTKVLVSPYPGMDAPVVASVWGKQLKLDGANDDRLDPFIERYLNNPGNTPEVGGICWSGVSASLAGEPQQNPYLRPEGSDPVGGILAADATATAEAQNPAASPVATPGSTPEATPAS